MGVGSQDSELDTPTRRRRGPWVFFPQRRQWNARLFLHQLCKLLEVQQECPGEGVSGQQGVPSLPGCGQRLPTQMGGRGMVGPAVGWRAEAAPALRRVPAGLLHPKREPRVCESVCARVCARSRVCACECVRARVCVCARAGSAPGTTPALQRDNTAATARPTRVLPGMPMTNPRPPNAVSPVTRLESAKFPTAPRSPLGN